MCELSIRTQRRLRHSVRTRYRPLRALPLRRLVAILAGLALPILNGSPDDQPGDANSSRTGGLAVVTQVENLARYAACAASEDLSLASRTQLPIHILDSLGCSIAALGAGPILA